MATEFEEHVPLNDFSDKTAGYRTIFDKCDHDNDGYVCVWELEDFINSNDAMVKNISHTCIRKIHKMADENNDQKLDFQEFVHMMENPELQHIFGYYLNTYVNFLVPRHKPVGLARVAGGMQMIDEYTCCPPPLFMFVISILEVACFITDEVTKNASTGFGVTGTIFMYDPSKRKQFWRYLTYMLVHAGYSHLCVNLAVQLILGVPLEMVHKWYRVLGIYFAGVIAGSLANSITDPWTKLVGASGGVYAILTAHIASVIMNWSEMMFPFVQLFLFSVLVICDLGQSIYDRYFLDIQDQVGISAHLGGALSGILMGIYTLRNLHITNKEKYLWWIALILYIILMGAAIIINIAWPTYFAQ